MLTHCSCLLYNKEMERWEAMKVFLRVAELTSFTKAAESLGLPKASVSAAVAQLESLTGAQLLQRTTRRVTVTLDGQAFYERCRDLLSDAEEVESMFRGGADLQGRLRVDMPSGLAKRLIFPMLPEFLRSHPRLELELSSTDRQVDLIAEGFDCVLRVGPPGDPSLMVRPLGELPIINCASPDYLERFGTPHSLEDLASHHLVHYAPRLGARPMGFEYREGDGYKTREMAGPVTVNNSDAYRLACLAGMGIIQVPTLGVRDDLLQGSLLEILPDLVAEPMPVSLVYPQRRHLSRRVKAFMDWVETTLRKDMDSVRSGEFDPVR